jgi:hypothetical protein
MTRDLTVLRRVTGPLEQISKRRKPSLGQRLLKLDEPCRPEPIGYTDEGSFSAAKWRWHELMLGDHLLPEGTRCILSYLAQRANWLDGGAYPGRQTIGDAVGFSISKVKRSLKSAITRGWLRPVRRGLGKTNLYILTADPRLVEAVETLQRITEGSSRTNEGRAPNCLERPFAEPS